MAAVGAGDTLPAAGAAVAVGAAAGADDWPAPGFETEAAAQPPPTTAIATTRAATAGARADQPPSKAAATLRVVRWRWLTCFS